MPHPAPWIGFESLTRLFRNRSVAVLSGAGVSTESGIPDYRGPETKNTDHTPIQYREFLEEPETRRHYWARSAVGWPTFDAASPNEGHRALAALEAAGLVTGIITQNVDRLHQAAGSERVVELHGALAEVRCLNCGALSSRRTLQERLTQLNPGWSARAADLAPDGDANLPRSATRSFRVPDCRSCGGILKPHVVFFGENAASDRVEEAWSLLAASDALLVAGSSLTVYSGFRFVRQAAQTDRPVGIVNLGETRGTPLASVHVDGKTGEVLPQLVNALGLSPESSPSSSSA
ncbi:NAD-dependent deacetylase [Salinibacter sp. 10B]|uniref:NAD-dependent protein deacetylase n=1 Tax=Salinibacter sp. 10B TaxID=1923971 RepID=UPI000CF4C4BE|nr:NAD-dependent protein deacetylase [Salinibacter sp. 10B]PQJ33554.1 NAD-dependent deacetylase [Salinibacter sp. 10B]